MGRLPGVSVVRRSGLILPPGRIRREILKSRGTIKISQDFLVATTAMTEFALRKLLERAKAIATQEQSEEVEKRHLSKALCDEFLALIFRGIYLPANTDKV